MKQEINPKDTNRAIAFELWMKSPMPMVTLTKTFDVTRLCKVSSRRGMKFNMPPDSWKNCRKQSIRYDVRSRHLLSTNETSAE